MSVFETLRERVDLADVASRFTELRPSGRRLVGLCPLHRERTSSFTVFEHGRFRCFGCEVHGDVTNLWAAKRGFGSLIEAALDLAREYEVRVGPCSTQRTKT